MKKLALKEFLKPDRRKLIVFIILGILFTIDFLLTLNMPCCMCDYQKEGLDALLCGPVGLIVVIISLIFLLLFLPLIFVIWFLFPKEYRLSSEYYLIVISHGFTYVIYILYTYLLSCLIIWIYDKIKKRYT